MEQTLTRNKNKGKTRIDWDLNVFCPEQWYGGETTWDADLWLINARIYDDGFVTDTDYTITLLPKEAEAIGLVTWANDSMSDTFRGYDSLDGWLDAGLDGFVDLYHFTKLYRDKCSPRLLEWLETLPQYIEDVPARMQY